ncbi:hypothetical protein JAAARDRAFT_67075 [Jaapia argillacea MUCL 33604]|uniref:Mid2 domain-containing protein n=1 Tax=Jaapia argillacea MUCL 33604 TaxID=933084 RepID=A0A067Q0Z4_9AGAM|nr:hypothetical protein JAAARDRAFT_67075 [Jaapia argillacea MUCL 33604]
MSVAPSFPSGVYFLNPYQFESGSKRKIVRQRRHHGDFCRAHPESAFCQNTSNTPAEAPTPTMNFVPSSMPDLPMDSTTSTMGKFTSTVFTIVSTISPDSANPSVSTSIPPTFISQTTPAATTTILPSDSTTFTSTSATSSSDSSSPPFAFSTSTPTPSTSSSAQNNPLPEGALANTNAGVIAGSIIGALVATLLIFLALLLYMRRRDRKRKARTAPSAEFLNMYRERDEASPMPGGLGMPLPVSIGRVTTRGMDEEDPPPPFSKGNFSDPVIEKVNASMMQRQEYERRAGSPRSFLM